MSCCCTISSVTTYYTTQHRTLSNLSSSSSSSTPPTLAWWLVTVRVGRGGWQTGGGGCGVCRKLGLGKVGQRQPPDRRLSQFCSRPAGLKLGHLQTSIPSGGECTCSAEEANWTPGSLVSATSPAIFGQIRSASLLTTSAISAGPCISLFHIPD